MIKIISAAAIVGALCLGTAGCGLDNNPTAPDTQPGDYFGVTDVNVHGRSVSCVTWKLGYAGGLSCDWGSK